MTGQLDEALLALLRSALPSLFGGGAPAVQLAALPGVFTLDASSTDAEAGQPRSDAASDTLPFVAAAPQGPYQLSRPPDTSVRKVRLATAAGDLIPLADAEVVFDPLDLRRFTLALRPSRPLAGVTGVRVLYGVTAVFAQLKYVQDLSLELKSTDAVALERAQTLAMAVLALNRPSLVAGGAGTEQADAYGAAITVKALHFVSGDAPATDRRRIALRAEFELKAQRALAEGEGAPIQHIRSPGSTSDRPVDIQMQVDA